MLRKLPGLLLLATLPACIAQAGMRFALGDEAGPGQHFLVTTDTLQTNIIQGQWTHDVDTTFLRAGEHRTIYRIPFFVPLLYRGTYARFYHPAYRYGQLHSDQLPLLVLDLGTFHPEPWSAVLGTSLDTSGDFYAALPDQIFHHYRRFLNDYLPEFDRQDIDEDLTPILQLFRELTAFVHSDRFRSGYRGMMRRVQPPGTGQDEAIDRMYSERLDRLDQALAEVEAWLRLDRPDRVAMRDWFDRRDDAAYFFSDVMDDADRARVQRFLDSACPRRRSWDTSWHSTGTGIGYTLKLRQGSSNICGGKLTVDMAPVLGLERCDHCTGNSHLQFTRTGEQPWELK